jgi:demethylmenaquinone methyltransferase/2-methoxy-6-polyprenyl-1,4-benzoquinol methylase
MSLHYNEKSKLVKKVFNKVYDKYDLMNDVISLGIHRIWKKKLVSWMSPLNDARIVDVASGTGDIAKLCSIHTQNKCEVTCVEPNKMMLLEGEKKLKNLTNLKWVLSPAEKLPFNNNVFDYYVISFGIRNVNDVEKSLNEAYRVLKKGGRFFCLEFSKVENEVLKHIYNQYSKLIPKIGKFIVGNEMPYEYLVKSIDQFYNQEEFLLKLKKSGFFNTKYRNLTNGVAAIHTGWKVE